MKTLITLSREPGIADALRSTLDSSVWRVIHHENEWDSGLLQIPGGVDAVVLECDLLEITPIRQIELLQKLQPKVPILLYTGKSKQEWEEEAYLAGASHILPKPVRGRLLNLMLERMLKSDEEATPTSMVSSTGKSAESERVGEGPKTLEVLRKFSEMLTHSLLSETLPRHFLQLLREILGVNRAAIFLRKPFYSTKPLSAESTPPRLNSACAIGLPNGLLEYFELSLGGGIGQHLHRHGRILKADSQEARQDREIQKEFELLGARVAIPILDREALLGVAVFDERLTGEPFSSNELALVFHALEELGLAIKNSWLHDQLANNHALLTEILDELTSGCVVVGRDLTVMHCNPAAKRFLGGEQTVGRRYFEFSDLPQQLGSRVFEALKTGVTVASFRYKPRDNQEACYNTSVIPFRRDNSALPSAALLLIEDFTQIQRSQLLEIEASNLRTIRSMAEHLSHEIGNALVPMSTHQQLLGEKYNDPEFQGSLSLALAQGIKRISRLSNQLLFLTRDHISRKDPIPALKLIEDAFKDAEMLYGMEGRHLEIENTAGAISLIGDKASLQHALSETLLNALQSSPPDSSVRISLETKDQVDKADASTWAEVQITDKGPGFTPDLAERAANPFFSTRTVGPGLGLTVAKRIIENHSGSINLVTGEARGRVAITLPVQVEAVEAAAENGHDHEPANGNGHGTGNGKGNGHAKKDGPRPSPRHILPPGNS